MTNEISMALGRKTLSLLFALVIIPFINYSQKDSIYFASNIKILREDKYLLNNKYYKEKALLPILLKKAKLGTNENMLREINFSKSNKKAQLAFGIPGFIFAGTTFYTGAYSVGSAISYTDPFLKEALIATAFSAISATGMLIISTKFKRKRFQNTKNTIEIFNSID